MKQKSLSLHETLWNLKDNANLLKANIENF